MATNLQMHWLKADFDSDIPLAQKFQVLSDHEIRFTFSKGGQICVFALDFRNSHDGIGTSPNGYEDGLYEWEKDGDDLFLKVAARVPENSFFPRENPEVLALSAFPHNVFLADGQTPVVDVVTHRPAWVPGATWTYPEKQEICVAAVIEMLRQKERDIETAGRYLDLHKDIQTHIGYWWRVAVAVVKRFFQDSDTDPLIVAEMAKQAAAGPTTREDQLALFRNLKLLIDRFPSGPDFAAIWVETRNLNSPSDVTRKTILEVLRTRGTAEDETYPLPSNFDSTDESWIVENQPGIVNYDNSSPARNDTVTATLTDYDGGVTNVTYRWMSQNQNGDWSGISGVPATQNSYTFDSTGTYRCRIRYDDNYGTGQEAFGAAFTVS